MRLDAARAWLTEALAGGESPRADADALLCHLLERDRGYLLSWPERELTPDQLARLEGWLARRQHGEPVAHILGEREFWSLSLLVSPATLIPRPDTEVLVEQALMRLPATPARVLDLGTGTGAIALALKSERPDDEVWAVDAQPDAVALARRNCERLRLPLLLRLGSWFEPLGDAPRFDLIVSNPPYIDGTDPHLAQGDVRFEPLTALVADEEGLADLRHIVFGARAHLAFGGWLLLEHGWQQGASVRRLLAEAGYDAIETVRDYGDNDRVTLGRFQGTT
ncbi:protein-glutamine N-methyltransferase HemK [Aeromonas diversa CDC 2478-85]|uniref:Release factor glutamine methyltransferase n=1 Tax=Aeromonas diversa CDC 2478-85 TaxID=1268237 RepID=N9U1V1_9GAMM|nr:peptide chain release factor N(5)-glutamine methyltransferase [Aeromonas diversa]ENY72280.1 protein-glutamine N-methyltransferase HemK [Aeromonas diversa CDC 2478-85]